jgi:long-chain fatty acid transport protein
MWRGRKFLLTATCILSGLGLSFSAWAGNVDTYGIGSKATALGGAYAAYADDPYAAYYNPAGLTQMQRPTASMGVMISDPELDAKGYSVENTPLSTPTDFEDDSLSVYPHLGFTMPLNEKWSVGLAGYVPFGLQIEWDDNSAANLTEKPGAYSSYESWYYREVVTPTAAYKVNDKWSVGFGVSLGRSEAGHEYQNYALTTGDGSPLPVALGPVNVEGEMDDSFNYSFNLGVMYKPMDTLTLGLTYRSQADADFEGEILNFRRNFIAFNKLRSLT